MKEKILKEIEKLENEMKNTEIAMNSVKEQIKVYNLKGQELAAHMNYIKGARDILNDLIKEGEEDEVSDQSKE